MPLQRLYAATMRDEDHLIEFIAREPDEWITVDFMIREEAIPGASDRINDRRRYESALQRLVDSDRVRTRTVEGQ